VIKEREKERKREREREREREIIRISQKLRLNKRVYLNKHMVACILIEIQVIFNIEYLRTIVFLENKVCMP